MTLRTNLGAVAVVTLVAAGCADPSGSSPDASAGGDGTTVSSCGRELTFADPPERVVTLDQSSTETLLALGLADRMVGTSNLKSRVAPEYQAAYAEIPVLSPDIPTAEQLREAAPDLVVSSFSEHFTRDRVGTRGELADLGLPSYVSAVDCPGANAADLTSFDRLFTDYENLGRIFGIEDRAADLVAEQRRATEEAAAAGETLADETSVVWVYSVYNDVPYVAGRGGMPDAMGDLAGLTNVFDDVDELWPEVSWEEVAARDPDVIVVGDLSERGTPGDSAEEKLAMMRDHPVVSQLPAMREDRIIEVPGIEMDPSVRTVDALGVLVEGLRDLGYVR
jgi:iron complex transport system substrate-binding protein